MPNDVFRAIDATLVLGVEDASLPEGTVADALVSEYDLSNTVGRLHQVTVSVLSDVQPFYEIGRRYPTHLRPGVVRVSGRAEATTSATPSRFALSRSMIRPPFEVRLPASCAAVSDFDPTGDRPGKNGVISVMTVANPADDAHALLRHQNVKPIQRLRRRPSSRMAC